MRLLPLPIRLAAATVGSVTVLGCGGAGTVDPRDYVGGADRICKAQLRANPVPATAPRNAREALRFGEREVETREQTDAQLRARTPPPDLKPSVDDFNARTEEVLELLARQNDASRRDDEKSYSALGAELEAAFERREREAKQIGFNVCGQRVKASSSPGRGRASPSTPE